MVAWSEENDRLSTLECVFQKFGASVRFDAQQARYTVRHKSWAVVMGNLSQAGRWYVGFAETAEPNETISRSLRSFEQALGWALGHVTNAEIFESFGGNL